MNLSNNDPSVPDRGKTGEFVGLFTRHSRRIFSYILTLVPNHADAEEIFQETSLTLWDKFGEYEQGTHFGAWACRIAYFKTLNFRSRQKHGPLTFSDEFVALVDTQMATSDDGLDASYRALADCYQKLDDGDRAMIDRRYAPGATTAKIADAVGRSTQWVYRNLARIHQRLFDCVTGAQLS